MKAIDKRSYGLISFPYSVEFETDEKLKVIIDEFGINGEMIITKLFAWIYGNKGYYADWSENGQCQFHSRYSYLKIPMCDINNVVYKMVKWGIFNEAIYTKYLVLTSKKIQTFWLELAKRERKYVSILPIEEMYCLIGDTHKKVQKKTGVIKGIWDAGEIDMLDEQSQKTVLRLVEWLKLKAPRVLQMKEVFTPQEAFKICKEADSARAVEVFLQMHNWANLFNNVNAYLTFWNWYRRHEEKFKDLNSAPNLISKTRKVL